MLVCVQDSLEVLPSAPPITDHKVVLPELEEAEQVEGVEGQGLVVEAEGESVVSVEGVCPPELGVDHDRIWTLRANALEQLDRAPVIAIKSRRDGEPEPRVRPVDGGHEALVNRHRLAVPLQLHVQLAEAFEHFSTLIPLHRVASVEGGEQLLV